MRKHESPAPTGLPRNNSEQDGISTDYRAPLYRGPWRKKPKPPEVLRRRFELYVLAFEDYVEERRAA
jgi:hypothetical protein